VNIRGIWQPLVLGEFQRRVMLIIFLKDRENNFTRAKNYGDRL
jgi:hypothetical protein